MLMGSGKQWIGGMPCGLNDTLVAITTVQQRQLVYRCMLALDTMMLRMRMYTTDFLGRPLGSTDARRFAAGMARGLDARSTVSPIPSCPLIPSVPRLISHHNLPKTVCMSVAVPVKISPSLQHHSRHNFPPSTDAILISE